MTTLTLGTGRKPRPEEVAYRAIHPMLAERWPGLYPAGRLARARGLANFRVGDVGIDARVQWCKDRGTFSIRYRTAAGKASEFTRNYRAVLANQAPEWTVQVYADPDTLQLINAYAVRTRDLYDHIVVSIDRETDTFRTCSCVGSKRLAPGGASFLPVAISEHGRVKARSKATLIGHGVTVMIAREVDTGEGLWTP